MNRGVKTNPVYYLFISVFLLGIISCEVEPEPIEEFSEDLERHIETLSSDEFEGRAPASEGGRKTVEYLESEFEKAGLKPAVNGSYRQPVPLREFVGGNFSDLQISQNAEARHSFSYRDEMVVTSSMEGQISIEDSELVFVGYGIVAPEYDWNDYEGIDVEGKTVVTLVNDPGFATEDEDLFTGRAMTYYGRWTYKFEEAARQGAEAALIVHKSAPASYGWGVVENSWTGTQYGIENDGDEQLTAEGWVHLDAAEKIFETGGKSVEEAMENAKKREFTAESLNQYASLSFNNDIQSLDCYNVIGYIEGSTYPDETVIYMGHWDHLGKDVINDEEVIYSGAVDNATGIGGVITMGERFANLDEPPKRSVVFMAVTAEESGLLGSQYYAENPVFPIEKTVAGINMDALNVYGPTHDVTAVGYRLSEIDEYLERHAEKQERIIKPNPSPEAGGFFRSDHFNFVRKGVPVLYASGGSDYIGKDEEYSEIVSQDMAGRYHQPSDVIHDLWDYDGIHQDLWLFYNIGKDIANDDEFIEWNEDVQWHEVRKESEEKRER